MKNILRNSLLIVLQALACTMQAVTYAPYKGQGIYTTTGRLEHKHIAAPAPMMTSTSSMAIGGSSSSVSSRGINTGSVSVSIPSLPMRSTSRMLGESSSTSLSDDSESDTSGPRRIAPPVTEGNPTPLGDALLPLMLMALAFIGYIFFRRKRLIGES